MRVSLRRSLPTVLSLGLGLGTLSCGDSTGPGSGDVVQVQDDSFNPSTKTITAGGAVTFQWTGAHQHNVTWVDQVTASPTQSSGTYARNFNTPGSYEYYCSIHGTPTSGMRGSIVVQ
jgi:plastocyanin